jgi:surface polysaccharide O-acyltransferase-like enzyme
MVSMLMVVVLHILGQGGVLAAVSAPSWRYGLCWGLEAAAFCAVDCYALISGYVGSGRRFRLTGAVLLWLRVVFYTLLITTAALVIAPGTVGPKHYLNAIFPVMTRQYWYVTAYFGAFFFMPVLEAGVEKLPKKALTALLAALTALLTVLSFVFGSDPFSVGAGYSAFWLAYLYMLGAYLRKYGLLEKLRGIKALAGFAVSTALTAGGKLLESFIHPPVPFYGNLLYNYSSLTVLAASVCLLGFFSGMRIGKRAARIVALLSPTALSVYLIHAHPIVWNRLLGGLFAPLAQLPAPLCVLAVLGCAAGVVIVCSAFDLLREGLFRLLRLKERIGSSEERIMK